MKITTEVAGYRVHLELSPEEFEEFHHLLHQKAQEDPGSAVKRWHDAIETVHVSIKTTIFKIDV